MNNWINVVMDLCTWVIVLVPWLLLRNSLPGYLEEKARNLARKEDIKEITDRVEAIKADYARQVEFYKHEIGLMEKRRELSAQVVDLINHYKELPPEEQDEEQRRAFEQHYYKLVPWIPTDLLKRLNSLFDRKVPAKCKPDVKDVIIAVRQAILKEDSGDFNGADIVHFVGFGKQRDGA